MKDWNIERSKERNEVVNTSYDLTCFTKSNMKSSPAVGGKVRSVEWFDVYSLICTQKLEGVDSGGYKVVSIQW